MTHSVNKIKLPRVIRTKVIKRNRVRISIERQRALHRHVHDHQPLAAESVREHLDGVADQQPGPRKRVEDAEHPDKEDHGLVGALEAVLTVQTGCQRPDNKGAAHAARGSEESKTTAELVDE